MEWYWILVNVVLVISNAWTAGDMVQEKKYNKAFVYIAACLFFIGLLILQTIPAITINIK